MRPRSVDLALVLVLVITSLAPMRVGSQQDSLRTAPRDTLESVVVRALRAGAAIPISQSTLDRRTIERTYAGQDAPLALRGLPSVTASSDAGAFSGYSSIRLRGVDQTRLAISMDGIPLNDPEDQVLYLSNVPDFMNSMESVRVQRGVGASAFGTAAFAGSLDFESLPIAATPAFAELQMTAGSWGTQRLSIEGATGLRGKWAGYLRASGHETDGYRRHSGNLARSTFASAGWFGERDALKFTGFAGRSKMHLAYHAASEGDLAVDPRANPMSPLERDDFWQAMASLQWTRVLREGTTLTTSAYRNAAGGNFDVLWGPDLLNYNLDHEWHGVLSTLSWSRGTATYSAGAHVSSYHRDHFLYARPDLGTRLYDNTGYKQEQSAFAKATWSRGALDLTADVQLRRAAFRYEPTPGSTIEAPDIRWLFLSPRLSVSWRLRPALTAFASLGRSRREPTRSDMFAGADDLDDSNASDLLPLDRVRPETLTDLEGGVRLTSGRFTATTNVFLMAFRDEIAPVGAISATGSPLRRNVERSSRVGVELEGELRASAALLLSGNLTWMRARIAAYEDEVNAIVHRDVPPLLSPAIVANTHAVWRAGERLDVSFGARHVGRSFLANDGDASLTLPAHTLVDGAATLRLGRSAVRLQAQNLLDAVAYASGYTDGTARYLFPVATRTLLATMSLTF